MEHLELGHSRVLRANNQASWGPHVHLGPDASGHYSNALLQKTLQELADFSLVNQCKPRLTVGAAHVRTFDSRDMLIAEGAP